MKAVLYGRFKQGLHSGSYSLASMAVSTSSLSFDVGLFFRSRFDFTPEQVRRFHTTEGGLRIYHNRADCLSPVVFKVPLFKSQKLSMRTIRRVGFVPRGMQFPLPG
ncbi:MAG: hypothetical protein OSA97_20815 [Nevskia sp.]|nr:hypothetical protein [Nevskia sp.]